MEVAFSHWSASWPVLACYVLAAAGQLAGLRRMAAARRAVRWREVAAYHLGLLIVVLSLVSPLGYWSGVYIYLRALQMLLVALIGPGLIVAGAPWQAFAQLATPRPAAARPGRGPLLTSMPVAAVVVSNAVWMCWQLPVLFDPARASAAVALAEHACYVGAGLLFWLQLISPGPLAPPVSPLRRLGLLIGTVGVFTVLGMVLVFGSGVLYPGYANSAHHVMTVLDDQQLSGAVLWMGCLLPFSTAGTALVLQWLSNEESEELAAGPGRLLVPRSNGWASRPVFKVTRQ